MTFEIVDYKVEKCIDGEATLTIKMKTTKKDIKLKDFIDFCSFLVDTNRDVTVYDEYNITKRDK